MRNSRERGYEAQARPLTGSSLLHGPKNSKALLFPYREICTHKNLRGIPLLYNREIGLRDFARSSGRALDSRIPETRYKSTLTFSLSYRDFSYRDFATRDVKQLTLPTPELPICRNSDARELTFQRSLHSIGISEFAISRILMHMFRDFSPRNPDKVCHLSPHLTLVAPHYSFSCRDIAFRDFAIPVAMFRDFNPRNPDTRFHV
jgi:hypothetical protein